MCKTLLGGGANGRAFSSRRARDGPWSRNVDRESQASRNKFATDASRWQWEHNVFHSQRLPASKWQSEREQCTWHRDAIACTAPRCSFLRAATSPDHPKRVARRIRAKGLGAGNDKSTLLFFLPVELAASPRNVHERIVPMSEALIKSMDQPRQSTAYRSTTTTSRDMASNPQRTAWNIEVTRVDGASPTRLLGSLAATWSRKVD